MAKKLKNSTKTLPIAREEDCYAHPESREKVYYSEEMVRQIGEQMLAYFKTNPHAIKISQYLVEKSIYKGTWEKWLQKYEFLREQQEFCKDIIGTRRELGMVFLELGQREGPNAKVMHIYDKDWQSIDRYHAELKAKSEAEAGKYLPTMPWGGLPVRDTGKVKPRKKKEEDGGELTSGNERGTETSSIEV